MTQPQVCKVTNVIQDFKGKCNLQASIANERVPISKLYQPDLLFFNRRQIVLTYKDCCNSEAVAQINKHVP